MVENGTSGDKTAESSTKGCLSLGVRWFLVLLVLIPAVVWLVRAYKGSYEKAHYVRIEAGSFMMGSPKEEPGHADDETQRRVTLTRAFEMSSTEVTQAQYEQVTGENPSHFRKWAEFFWDKDRPVESVSWHDAVRYCNMLSEQAGLSTCYECSGGKCEAKPGKIYDCEGYRLPTEAEWEYAARAGTSTAYYGGGSQGDGSGEEPALDRIGWYYKNSRKETHVVKGKEPNAWGLYDMSGNVWEWCHDRPVLYSTAAVTDPAGATKGSSRAARGGSWLSSRPYLCRSAYRNGYSPESRFSFLGFRPVRTLRK